MNIKFFATPGEFRKWLSDHHENETELEVGFYRKATGKPSITWSESVDVALCFGWIDGIRHKIDEESYSIRFTPRNPSSNWSDINIRKAEQLIKDGLMETRGLDLFLNRKILKPETYSYESLVKKWPNDFEKIFRSENTAWDFFCKQPPSYRRTSIHWVISAKQQATSIRRLRKLMDACMDQKRLF